MDFFGSKAGKISLIMALSVGVFSVAQYAAAADDKPTCNKGSIGTVCEPEDKDIVIGSSVTTKRVIKPGTGPTNPLAEQIRLPANKRVMKVQN